MSHIVTIQTRLKEPLAIGGACLRLGLAPPVRGTAKLFSGEAIGLLVQLPGWRYPTVIDIDSGEIRFDNYEGTWGDQKHLDQFLQAYAIERTCIEARKKGYSVIEQPLQDGSVKLVIGTGA